MTLGFDRFIQAAEILYGGAPLFRASTPVAAAEMCNMNLPGKIETMANIATIGVAVLLSAVLVKGYLLPAPSPSPPVPPAGAATSVGTSLKRQLPGVDWSKNGRTLVLAISTQCHFCKDSTPFYRKLQEQVGKSLRTVAVLPQPVAEAEQYLNGEGVHVDQVKQATMSGMGSGGRPPCSW